MDESMLTEDIDSALRALGKNVNVITKSTHSLTSLPLPHTRRSGSNGFDGLRDGPKPVSSTQSSLGITLKRVTAKPASEPAFSLYCSCVN